MSKIKTAKKPEITEFIPVLALNREQFMYWARETGEDAKKKPVVLTNGSLIIGKTKYFHVNNIRDMRGVQFKSFVTYGGAMFHSNYHENLDWILQVVQRNKNEPGR